MFKTKTVGYVSELDQFLSDFDETHAKSATQQAEIKKYKKIHYLRDHVIEKKDQAKIWEDF